MVDSARGSGHFLLAAARRVWKVGGRWGDWGDHSPTGEAEGAEV